MAITAQMEQTNEHPNPRVVRYPGPRPCLEFTFQLTQRTRTATINFINYLISCSIIAESGKSLAIGPASSENLQQFKSGLNQENNSGWQVLVPIDTEVVGAIEQIRRTVQDGSVTFEFDWEVISLIENRGSHAFNEIAVEKVEPVPKVRVARDEWVALLDQLEWDTRKVLEVRFPSAHLQRWQEALEHLNAAKHAFGNGIDNLALQECENALEKVTGQSGPAFSAALMQEVTQSIKDVNKARVTKEAVEKAVNFVRRGKHLVGSAGTSAYDVDGRDAEFGLILTKALLVYLSKLKGSLP